MANFTALPLRNLAQSGIAPDAPRTALAPNVWSDGRNVRFTDGSVEKMRGHTEILNQPDRQGGNHMRYWNVPLAESYVTVTNTSIAAEVSRIRSDGNTTNINPTGGFTFNRPDTSQVPKWNSTTLSGGYGIVINNGIDAPQYLLEGETTEGRLTGPPWLGIPGYC